MKKCDHMSIRVIPTRFEYGVVYPELTVRHKDFSYLVWCADCGETRNGSLPTELDIKNQFRELREAETE